MLKRAGKGYRRFMVFLLVLVMAVTHIGANAGMVFAAENAAGSEGTMISSGSDDQRESIDDGFSGGEASDEAAESEAAEDGGAEKESKAAEDSAAEKEREAAEDGAAEKESEATENGGEEEESEAAENGGVEKGRETAENSGEGNQPEIEPESQLAPEAGNQPELELESQSVPGAEKESEAAENKSEENQPQKRAAGLPRKSAPRRSARPDNVLQENPPSGNGPQVSAVQGDAPQGEPPQGDEPQIATVAVYEGLLKEPVMDRIPQVSVNVMVKLNKDLVSVDLISVEGTENDGDVIYDFFYPLPGEYAGYAVGSVSAAPGFKLTYENGVVSGQGQNLKDGEVYNVTVTLTAEEMAYGVKHVLKGAEEDAVETTAGYGLIGEMTDAQPVKIEGYVAVEIHNEVLEGAGQIILIVYVPESEAVVSYYTVSYIDKESGDKLAEPETRFGIAGTQVTVRAKGFEGYAADGLSKSVTLKTGANEIIFEYAKITGRTYRVVYQYMDGTVIEERIGLPVLGAGFVVNADPEVVRSQAGKGYKLDGDAHPYFTLDPEKDGSAPENTVTFVFVPEKYRISYEGLEGSGWENLNPSEYTVEDEIRLANPEKDGYVFVGWALGDGIRVKKESEKEHDETEVVIERGTVGDLLFRAIWKEIPSQEDNDQREPDKEQENQPKEKGGEQSETGGENQENKEQSEAGRENPEDKEQSEAGKENPENKEQSESGKEKPEDNKQSETEDENQNNSNEPASNHEKSSGSRQLNEEAGNHFEGSGQGPNVSEESQSENAAVKGQPENASSESQSENASSESQSENASSESQSENAPSEGQPENAPSEGQPENAPSEGQSGNELSEEQPENAPEEVHKPDKNRKEENSNLKEAPMDTAAKPQKKAEDSPEMVKGSLKAVNNSAASENEKEEKEQKEKKEAALKAYSDGDSSGGQSSSDASHQPGGQYNRNSGIQYIRMFKAISEWLQRAMIALVAAGVLVMAGWRFRLYRKIFGR